MKLKKKMKVNLGSYLPLILGIFLGTTLSHLFAPILDHACGFTSRLHSVSENIESVDMLDGNDVDAEATEIQSTERIETNSKVLRPRYVATELGIKEKLLTSVIVNSLNLDFVLPMNQTLSPEVSKLIFFMDSASAVPGLSVISFAEQKIHESHLEIIKYVSERFGNSYDFFMFIPDDLYVNGRMLMKLVHSLNIVGASYYGNNIEQYCSLQYGIIVSQEALRNVARQLHMCSGLAGMDGCLGKLMQTSCSPIAQGAIYHNNPVKKSEVVMRVPGSMVFFSHMATPTDFYVLSRYLTLLELEESKHEIYALQQKTEHFVSLGPGGSNQSWPSGFSSSSRPKTRFDVIAWQFFNNEYVLQPKENVNIQELQEPDREDIDELLHTIRLRYQLVNKPKLISGYRRFDPARGMEYQLHLIMDEVDRQIFVLKPLSEPELVPMPYVTENSRINMILPVNQHNKDGVVSFLDSYAHSCLDSGDNVNLFIVFIYSSEKSLKEDPYAVLKSMITYYEGRYLNGARMAWSSLWSSGSHFEALDLISLRFSTDSLILHCTVGMELSTEFLNRVRMNTIMKHQVFFPIGFWQYKPNLVYDEKPFPTKIDINSNHGHFNVDSYQHASFYNSDYKQARRAMTRNESSLMDLYDAFLSHHSVHVLRAVEPALILRYKGYNCSLATLHAEECLRGRAHSLANQAQLAMLILDMTRS